MIFKLPRYRMNKVRILPCENRKTVLIDRIAPLKILYKMPGISSKSHKLVIKYSLANSLYDRIYAHKEFGSISYNVHCCKFNWEGGSHVYP